VYNATAAASLSVSLGASLSAVRAGLEAFSAAFGRFERIPTGGKTVVMLLVKNPAGANEVLRTLETGVPPVLIMALNDAIADGQDVSWIWDVDFEPVLEHAGHVVATGERAPVRCGCCTAVLRDGSRSSRRSSERSTAVWSPSTPARLVILPTYTAMLASRGPTREARAPVLGGRATAMISVGHLYPGYLNIYADRGNIAVLHGRAALRGHELDVRPVGIADRFDAEAYDLLYIGGGQDREQPHCPDLATRATRPEAVAAGQRCSPCAAATSSSDGAIAAATARSCPESGSSRTRRSPGTRG
jgi:hypothetical protein